MAETWDLYSIYLTWLNSFFFILLSILQDGDWWRGELVGRRSSFTLKFFMLFEFDYTQMKSRAYYILDEVTRELDARSEEKNMERKQEKPTISAHRFL